MNPKLSGVLPLLWRGWLQIFIGIKMECKLSSLLYRREFDYYDVLRLWEVLWSHHLSEHFHLYMCVAILKRHRRKIMDEQMEFDTLLKFINELSGHIELESTLRDTEALCLFAGEKGAACIPPGTPPSLPVVEVDPFAVQASL
jgi:hypothetical protein